MKRNFYSNITLTLAVPAFVLVSLLYAATSTADEQALNKPPKGFVALFNGKDLSGWKGLLKGPYDNPSERAKLSPEKLKELQKEADDNMHAHWTVADGALVFDGKGRSMCTAKDYSDFEMLVDWKILKDGDSGIYLRGSPQVQIWDTQRPSAHVGSGGLYNNRIHPRNPIEVADKPVGQWNTFRITMVGEKVTVLLNEVLVVDNVVMENYWQRDKPIYPNGQIELQNHGNTLYFRNIYLREITNMLNDKENSDGFKLLFNGKDLTGWVGNKKSYIVKDGIMICDPSLGGNGNLYTEEEYGDFIFRFEFRLTPGANNGLGIRAPLTGNAAYDGMELQILDDQSPKYEGWLKDYQHHGSVYGVVPAKTGFLKPPGQWNYQEVIAKGKQITVKLNGTTIVDADIEKASTPKTVDGNNHPGLMRSKG
ncbi:MAG: 3-keto-disaccharide hydrolase, partial [Planctomycetota bacterium]